MDGRSTVPQVCVIVPTLSEVDNIDVLLRQLLPAFRDHNLDIEILLADGGSTDGTVERVQAWAPLAPVHLVHAASGRGLTGDVLVAARQTKAKVVVVMDADLSHSPDAAPILAQPVLDGSRDMVIGSRYIPGGQTPNWAWTRRAISRIATGLVWPLTDVHDPTSGFFAIRRDKLLDIPDDADGFKLGLEVLLRNGENLRVMEVPISFGDRVRGRSKMNARQVACYLRRSAALAGGVVTGTTAGRFALAGLLSLIVDIGTFQMLWAGGLDLRVSHVFSFLLATTLGYLLNRRWVFAGFGDQHGGWGTCIRFVVVGLMALFLRGGVVATLTYHAGWRVQAAMTVAVFTAIGVNYLGCAFFVFRRELDRSGVLRWRVAAIGLVGYTVLLRLAYLGLVNLLPEEAYYWNYAQHPDLGYLDHPPMVAWLISIGTALVGDTELGIRLGTFLCWFVTAGFCFGLARHQFGKAVGLVAMMLAALLPFFFIFGFFTTPDVPLTACWAGALFFLERALLAQRRWGWWGLGVCMGLGMLSKYTMALLGPATLAFLLLDRRSRRWLRRPEPYAAAFMALLLFLPVILWNIEHDWASFAFQGTRRLRDHPEFGLHVLALSLVELITPLGVIGAFQAILSRRDWRIGTGTLGPAVFRRWLFTAVFTGVPLCVFVLFSLRHSPKLNWTGPVWLAVLPVIARQMVAVPGILRGRSKIFGPQMWAPTLTGMVVLFGGFLHYTAIGLPGVGIDSDDMHLPVIWEEIGRDVEQMEEQIETNLGVEPLVVGMDKYFMASELAFYRRDGREGVEQTASRSLFGENGLMYAFWFPSERQAGRVLLLVSFDCEDIDEHRIGKWADRMGPIEERVLHKYGDHVRYFWRIVYGYRPHPAQTHS